MIDARHFEITDTLKDGTPVTIRAIQPNDKKLIKEAFKNLKPETIYKRFFRFKSELTEDELKRINKFDFETNVALVVTVAEKNREIIIGAAQYYVLGNTPDALTQAEVSFTVEEDYQGQGMGSRLLKQLIRIAREKGVDQFVAKVLPQNKAMLAVFAHSGLPVKQNYEDGFISVTISLTESGF
jgi:L-amino acid N-acyltransferase YncA